MLAKAFRTDLIDPNELGPRFFQNVVGEIPDLPPKRK